VLDETGDQLELSLALWAPELVLVVSRRIKVPSKAIESSERFVANVALIEFTIERRGERDDTFRSSGQGSWRIFD